MCPGTHRRFTSFILTRELSDFMHYIVTLDVKQLLLSAFREAWLSEHILMMLLSFESKILQVSFMAQVWTCVMVEYIPKGFEGKIFLFLGSERIHYVVSYCRRKLRWSDGICLFCLCVCIY